MYYGQYWNKKQGRWYVYTTPRGGGKPRYMLVSRAVMEQQMGRLLDRDETVDHINEDCTDDSLANLQILTLRQNIRKHFGPRMLYTYACAKCGVSKTIKMADYRWARSQGKGTRFCSKSCWAKIYWRK